MSSSKYTEVIILSSDDDMILSNDVQITNLEKTAASSKPDISIIPLNSKLPTENHSVPDSDIGKVTLGKESDHDIKSEKIDDDEKEVNGLSHNEVLCVTNLPHKRKLSESESCTSAAKKALKEPISLSSTEKEVFVDFIGWIKPLMKCNDADATKIENSLNEAYSRCDPAYVKSSTFLSYITKVKEDINTNKNRVFVFIKDFHSELKRFKIKKEKVVPSTSSSHQVNETSESSKQNSSESEAPEDAQREKYIRRLERYLGKISKKIVELQHREMSLEDLDHEDSYYIREEKLKQRFVKIWNLICRERKCSATAGRPLYKKFHYRGSKHEEINEKIERFVNKKKIFPDYADVLKIVTSAFEEKKLKVSPSYISELARDVFKDVGLTLIDRRKKDEEDAIDSYVLYSNTPFNLPEESEDLKKCLDDNALKASSNMQKLIDEFVEKQDILKEEPSEVPDDAPLSEKGEEDSSSSDEEEVEDVKVSVPDEELEDDDDDLSISLDNET